MKYLVMEIQNNNDSVSNIVTAFDDINEAWSKYHTILSYAAISTVAVHTALLLNDSGEVYESRVFRHLLNTENN